MWPKGRTASRSGVGGRSPVAGAVIAMLAALLSTGLIAACTAAPNPQPAPTTASTTTRTKSGPGGLDLAALLDGCRPTQPLYICGPKGMIDAAIAAATVRGWTKEHIHIELFVEATSQKGDGQPVESAVPKTPLTK